MMKLSSFCFLVIAVILMSSYASVDAYKLQLYKDRDYINIIYTKTGTDFGAGLGCFTLPSAAQNQASSAHWYNCYGEGRSSCAQVEFYSEAGCNGSRLGIWQTPTSKSLLTHNDDIASIRISQGEECKSCE